MYTDQCAKYLIDNGISDNVCIMNFASRHHCGGGYINGAIAQEEDLCRVIPALYSSLSKISYPFKEDSILITPKIEIWRDQNYNIMAKPYTISVVSAAAQNLKFEKYFDANLCKRVLASIFQNVHKELGSDTLVLGAWGCGAYRNDPHKMSEVMNEVCEMYGGLYKNIVFAIPAGENFEIFRQNIKTNNSISV
jgi:uncharacterized protein (TIGR02452 family)